MLRPRAYLTRPLWILVVLATAAATVPSLATAQSPEEQHLAEAEERIDDLGDAIARAEDEADDAEARLRRTQQRLDEIEAIVNDVALALERQQVAVDEAAAELERVEREAREVEAEFSDRIAAMFKHGSGPPAFQALFSAEDVQEALERSSLLVSLAEADTASLEELSVAEVAVAAKRQRLEAERERLAQMQAEQKDLFDRVAEIRDSRAAVAAEAESHVEHLHDQRDDLEADQQRLEELIEARQSAPASIGTPSKAGYIWPACGPVTSEYGYRWGRPHRGIDLGAPHGSGVVAAKGGSVIQAGYHGGYGNLTLIDHGDGVVTGYAHQSSIQVSVGQYVRQGQRIGAVGSTGNSTGPHLHFETRVNGNAVNPRRFLSGGPSC